MTEQVAELMRGMATATKKIVDGTAKFASALEIVEFNIPSGGIIPRKDSNDKNEQSLSGVQPTVLVKKTL